MSDGKVWCVHWQRACTRPPCMGERWCADADNAAEPMGALLPEDLMPMTPEQITEVRSQRDPGPPEKPQEAQP